MTASADESGSAAAACAQRVLAALRAFHPITRVPLRDQLLAVHRGPELASYYVVAEALISAAKHADAPAVTVSGCGDDDDLSLYVTDDGVGGADVRSDRG